MPSGRKEMAMNFSVFVKKEEGMFVAHCLELDIVATAPTLKQVQIDMFDLLSAQISYAFANNNLANLYNPAPPEVWKEFFECKDSWEKKSRIEKHLANGRKSFVPPWVIAKMCRKAADCNA